MKTEHNELLFESKFYVDSGLFKDAIDEEELLREIESIPDLLKKHH